MEPKSYRVASEQARIDEEIARALARGTPCGKRRPRGASRTHYESLEAIMCGEEMVVNRAIRGRIVA